jgi:shikimate kinase
MSESGGVPYLVVIVGPIASGKSTVADALGRRFREAGRAVAVLDLDDVVETIGGFVDLTAAHFQQSQIVYGELIGVWLRQGFDVIAHGPFFQRQENEALLHAVPQGIEARRVHLRATYEVALERVAADPTRGLSKDPTVLRHTYDRVESLLPAMPRSEWTFDTTTTSWQKVVNDLATAFLDRQS